MRPTPWPDPWPDHTDPEPDAAAPSPYPDDLAPLERLILRENCLDILRALEPEELVIAALRLEGLSDAQIGHILGLSRSTVTRHLTRAQERIMRELPYTAGLLAGRQPDHSPVSLVEELLEQGWICDWSDPDDWPEPGDPTNP
jgi:DNA-binding transcriptional ArsR family regulator